MKKKLALHFLSKIPTIKKAVKLINSIGVLKLTAINFKKNKNMKNFSKYFSIPLAFLYLFISVVSCNSNEITNENVELKNQAESNAKRSLSFYQNFKKTISKNASYQRNGLTQKLLDTYLVEAGFNEGDVTVENVNEIISKISESKTFNQKINETNFTDFTKNHLIEMKESGVIENLHLQPEFHTLDLHEKEALLNSNELLRAYSVQEPNTNVPCPSEACTGTLILLGAGIGGAICGPVCALAGGVIGLIVGIEIK